MLRPKTKNIANIINGRFNDVWPFDLLNDDGAECMIVLIGDVFMAASVIFDLFGCSISLNDVVWFCFKILFYQCMSKIKFELFI